MVWESLESFEKTDLKESGEILRQLLRNAEREDKYKDLKRREKFYSYGIGKGVVLYKLNEDREKPALYLAVNEKPVEYDAFDGINIEVFCLLLLPEDENLSLDYTSGFYRLLNFATLREQIKQAESEEEVRRLLKREEEGLKE